MSQPTIKLLIAYDGSGLSLDAVHYVGEAFPPERTEVVIFYVETKIPRSFWRMEKEMDFRYKSPEIRAVMAARVKTVNQAMEKASSLLLKAGFKDQLIISKIHTKQGGIVEDIVRESLGGYDALVLGRKGHSRVKDFLIDSVPTKLLGKIRNIPLIVVGGRPTHKNILVAFDGTRQIMKAVKQMSCLINTLDCRLLMCHVDNSGRKFIPESKTGKGVRFNGSKTYLLDAGFSEEQITCEIIDDRKSPTRAILEKARSDSYGTVVIGRRGLTFFKRVFLSRVGNAIFRNAEDLVVWVVQ